MTESSFPPSITGVLAVVAHPDDESFALGAVLAALVAHDAQASVICFTQGEASSLHGVPGDLAALRSGELSAAAAELGVGRVELLHYPDGGLASVPLPELTAHVLRLIREEHPSHLLVFDLGGVTGHPDHHRATQAALSAAGIVGLPVLAWALPRSVAERLNAELGTAFAGRNPWHLDISVQVPREVHRRAIDHHRSQAIDNAVLWRRLELLGDNEYLRLLHPHPASHQPAPA